MLTYRSLERNATVAESFIGKLRDERLNGELFYTLRETQELLERWRVYYNTIRPHGSLGYRPPAPETLSPIEELHTLNLAATLLVQ